MATNAPITVDTGLTNMQVLPVRVAAEFLKAKRNYGKLVNFCNKDAAKELVSGPGRVVNVPLAPLGGGSATLTDGNSIVLDNTIENGVAVTLDTYRYCAIALSDVARSLSSPSGFESLMAGRMASLLNDIEADVSAAADAAFTTNVVGTYTAGLNEDIVAQAAEKLATARAPEGRWAGFLHPEAMYELSRVPRATEARIVGAVQNLAPVATGPVGTYIPMHGINFHMSQAVAKSTNNIDNLVFHPDALLFASRPIAPQYDGLGVISKSFNVDGMWVNVRISANNNILGAQIVISCLYGVDAGREDWGCVIRS